MSNFTISAKMPKMTNKGSKPKNRAIGKSNAQIIEKKVLVDSIGFMMKNAITRGT
jgi:hypothetical protein